MESRPPKNRKDGGVEKEAFPGERGRGGVNQVREGTGEFPGPSLNSVLRIFH